MTPRTRTGASIVRATLALSLVIGAAVAVACGGDDETAAGPADASFGDGSSDGGGGPSDAAGVDGAAFVDAGVGTFCAQTLGLYLPKFESCCDKDAAPSAYDNDHALISIFAELCRESLGKSVASGRASLDSAAAATCAASLSQNIAATPCPDTARSASNQPTGSVFHDANGCAQAIVGLQGEGSPCANDYECRDGLTCVGWTPKSDGTCKTPPAQSQPCGNGVPEGGAFADIVRWGFGSHPRCVAGDYCAATALQPGTCRPAKEADASCFDPVECATGLRCQLETCATAPPSPASSPCRLPWDCADHLYCKTPDDGGLGTCTPRELGGTACSSTSSTTCAGACAAPVGGGAFRCVDFCGTP